MVKSVDRIPQFFTNFYKHPHFHTRMYDSEVKVIIFSWRNVHVLYG